MLARAYTTMRDDRQINEDRGRKDDKEDVSKGKASLQCLLWALLFCLSSENGPVAIYQLLISATDIN